jgi:hypothetical protein
MPKTGTSSIQEYLYFCLRDRNFFYINFGEANGSKALSTISLDEPEKYWIHQRKGISVAQTAKLRARYIKHLNRSLQRSKQNGQTAVLSGEDCWKLGHKELQQLKQVIARNGFEIHLIVYLRSYLSWLESSFQQKVKWGFLRNNPLAPDTADNDYGHLDYLSILNRLADVFGETSLIIRPYRRRELTKGCVVRDFCAQAGINSQGTTVPRSNDGISLDAVRFFYSYWKFASKQQTPSMRQNNALIHSLQELPGEKLRFHSSIMTPVADRVEQQRSQILARFGVDLGTGQAADETAPNIVRCEEDLYQFNPESLGWLSARSGCRPIHGQGESTARLVAAAMERLQRRALWTHWHAMARQRLRMEWKRWTRWG